MTTTTAVPPGTSSTEPPVRRHRTRPGEVVGQLFRYLALLIASVLFLLPFYLIVRNALSIDPEITSPNWTLFPKTLHWENLTAFGERFARVRTTPDIFAIDGARYTCSGGTAALDMMLSIISARDGRALANAVSEQFIHPRIRDTRDSQRMAVQSRLAVANERLIAAVDMMESASDDPQPVHAIAAAVGLSPRQLERLFVRYLRETPSRHYMKVRLERARAMLLQTTKPVLDVAVASGFTSASHFSRCYRATYGRKPSDERAGLRQ